MPRIVVAYVIGAALLLPVAITAEDLGVGSWGMTGIGVFFMFVVSLIDREGFYGPREDDSLR